MTSARGLTSFLSRHPRVAIDTSPFIYHLQDDPRYTRLTDTLFAWIEGGGAAVTSTLTMVELLTRPHREKARHLVDAIYGLGSRYPNLTWIAPSLEIAYLAALARARDNLKTPDAIQLATAIHAGATGLITNDSAFKRVTEVEVILFDA